MITAGKCPPEPEALEAAAERGFQHVELYLERRHIDSFEESLEACRDSPVEVVSVHTPHVNLDEPGYIEAAGRLARELDAYLVVHSQYINHFHTEELEQKIDLGVEYGYENQPGTSAFALENLVLGRGHGLVLDVAHLYMAEQEFFGALEHFLHHRTESVEVVHLSDSTRVKDGLGFGDGGMDMERTCRAVADSPFDGTVVLEVMPEHQEQALETWRSI